jgi:hypothetical protein
MSFLSEIVYEVCSTNRKIAGAKAICKAPNLTVKEAQKRVITKVTQERPSKELGNPCLAVIAVEGYQTEY